MVFVHKKRVSVDTTTEVLYSCYNDCKQIRNKVFKNYKEQLTIYNNSCVNNNATIDGNSVSMLPLIETLGSPFLSSIWSSINSSKLSNTIRYASELTTSKSDLVKLLQVDPTVRAIDFEEFSGKELQIVLLFQLVLRLFTALDNLYWLLFLEQVHLRQIVSNSGNSGNSRTIPEPYEYFSSFVSSRTCSGSEARNSTENVYEMYYKSRMLEWDVISNSKRSSVVVGNSSLRNQYDGNLVKLLFALEGKSEGKDEGTMRGKDPCLAASLLLYVDSVRDWACRYYAFAVPTHNVIDSITKVIEAAEESRSNDRATRVIATDNSASTMKNNASSHSDTDSDEEINQYLLSRQNKTISGECPKNRRNIRVDLLEVGGGTGYWSRFFYESKRFTSVLCTDVVPTDQKKSSYGSSKQNNGTETKWNEYHGDLPSWLGSSSPTSYSYDRAFFPCNSLATKGKSSSKHHIPIFVQSLNAVDSVRNYTQSSALSSMSGEVKFVFMCYPPPNEAVPYHSTNYKNSSKIICMASEVARILIRKGSSSVLLMVVGEFGGDTGSQQFEDILLNNFELLSSEKMNNFINTNYCFTIWRLAKIAKAEHDLKGESTGSNYCTNKFYKQLTIDNSSATQYIPYACILCNIAADGINVAYSELDNRRNYYYIDRLIREVVICDRCFNDIGNRSRRDSLLMEKLSYRKLSIPSMIDQKNRMQIIDKGKFDKTNLWKKSVFPKLVNRNEVTESNLKPEIKEKMEYTAKKTPMRDNSRTILIGKIAKRLTTKLEGSKSTSPVDREIIKFQRVKRFWKPLHSNWFC